MVGRRAGLDRDGLRQQSRLGRQRLRGHRELRERRVRESRPRGEPVRQAGQGRLEQLDRPLAGCGQHRRDGNPEEVERRCRRQCVEVAGRDEPTLLEHDERVLLRSVQLNRELPLRERERIAGGAVHLRQRAEAERILQVARGSLVPQVAPCQEPAQAVEGGRQAGIRPGGRNLRVEHREIRGEGLEIERAGDVEGVEEPAGIGRAERRVPGRERVMVEQGEAFAGGELDVDEQDGGEIGVRRQVGLSDRAECPHVRRGVLVQRAQEVVEELGPDAGRSPGKAVGHPDDGRPNDVGGVGRPLPDAMAC